MTTQNLKLDVLADKNLFVFPDHMSRDNRDAAKECHAFSTQAANLGYHPVQQAQQWFNEYLRIMTATGWTPLKYEVQTVSESGMQLEVSNLLGKGLQAAAGFVSGNVVGGVKNLGAVVVDALAKNPKAVEVLNVSSREDDRTGLSLSRCDQSPDGEVMMLVSAMQTDADPGKNRNLLLFKWESTGTTNLACAAALTFTPSIYQKAQAIVRGKLSDKALETLLSLQL